VVVVRVWTPGSLFWLPGVHRPAVRIVTAESTRARPVVRGIVVVCERHRTTRMTTCSRRARRRASSRRAAWASAPRANGRSARARAATASYKRSAWGGWRRGGGGGRSWSRRPCVVGPVARVGSLRIRLPRVNPGRLPPPTPPTPRRTRRLRAANGPRAPDPCAPSDPRRPIRALTAAGTRHAHVRPGMPSMRSLPTPRRRW